MNAEHEPDPAFVDHLEWQLRTTVRRQNRFAEPVTRRGRSLVRSAALIALSLTLGAAGAVAAGRLQDERQRELLLTHVEVREHVARVRLTVATEALERAELRFREGITSQVESWDARRRELVELFELDRLVLEREEIEQTGRGPQDGLSSQAVFGRDFVAERLELEQRLHEGFLGILHNEHQRAVTLVEHGVLNTDEVGVLELQVRELQVLVDDIAQRLLLRRRYLSSELSAEAVEYESWRLDARRTLEPLRAHRDYLRQSIEQARVQFEAGLVRGSVPQELELQLVEVEAALRLHELEAEMMEAQFGQPGRLAPVDERQK